MSTDAAENTQKSLQAADRYSFDRLLHAQEARFTGGLSVTALWLACADWAAHMANAPARRAALGRFALKQWERFFRAAAGEHVIDPLPQDHRFRSPLWQEAPYNALHQGFLLAQEWWAQACDGGPAIARHNQEIVSFTARQWLDVFSPSNSPWLNPQVGAEVAATSGRNFLKGAENFASDMKDVMGNGSAERYPFVLGKDLAATPGKIVFRNALIELIQYTPQTGVVRPEPVLIVPAWIMKYYILDLSQHNSLVRYLVGQGYTVFAISWRNPTADLRALSFDDYRREGAMAALDAVTAICGDVGIHGCGYCLGGTLLTIAAAAMARQQDHRLKSLTLLAAQTDFTEAGELQLFISEGQLSFLEDVMTVRGVLESSQMSGAFQILRSNDLVWSRLIRTYLLGRVDTANDLMAWNADGTRLPARMHSEYLRHLYLDNDLAEGRFMVDGQPISLNDIRLPTFLLGTETDHIAPWRSVYKLHLLSRAEITFVLTAGGHNAGVVSEPGHPRRFFQAQTRTATAHYQGPEEWRAQAPRQEGSWWPFWAEWLAQNSGQATADAPPMGAPDKGYAPLCDAPGTYIFER